MSFSYCRLYVAGSLAVNRQYPVIQDKSPYTPTPPVATPPERHRGGALFPHDTVMKCTQLSTHYTRVRDISSLLNSPTVTISQAPSLDLVVPCTPIPAIPRLQETSPNASISTPPRPRPAWGSELASRSSPRQRFCWLDKHLIGDVSWCEIAWSQPGPNVASPNRRTSTRLTTERRDGLLLHVYTQKILPNLQSCCTAVSTNPSQGTLL